MYSTDISNEGSSRKGSDVSHKPSLIMFIHIWDMQTKIVSTKDELQAQLVNLNGRKHKFEDSGEGWIAVHVCVGCMRHNSKERIVGYQRL